MRLGILVRVLQPDAFELAEVWSNYQTTLPPLWNRDYGRYPDNYELWCGYSSPQTMLNVVSMRILSGRLPVHVNMVNDDMSMWNPDDPISGFAGIPRCVKPLTRKCRTPPNNTCCTPCHMLPRAASHPHLHVFLVIVGHLHPIHGYVGTWQASQQSSRALDTWVHTCVRSSYALHYHLESIVSAHEYTHTYMIAPLRICLRHRWLSILLHVICMCSSVLPIILSIQW